MTQTRVLAGLAISLLLADIIWHLEHRAQPISTPDVKWLLSMPELEYYQTANPDNLLFSSENWDERLPAEAVVADPDILAPIMQYEGRTTKPLLEELIACRPKSVIFDNRSHEGPQMPPRYAVIAPAAHMNTIQHCIHDALPKGYVARIAAE